MILIVIDADNEIRVNDRTRIDLSRSFISVNENPITKIEVCPDGQTPSTGDVYYDITTNQFLDWIYSTDGTKKIRAKVTNSDGTSTLEKSVSVLDEADDIVFNNDSDLVMYEPDIFKYIREGRSSFIDIQRLARDRILSWLDEHRIWDSTGEKLTVAALVSKVEFKDWSRFTCLRIIFEAQSNSIDDIFSSKANKYSKLEDACKARAAIRVDEDGDGIEDNRQELGSIRIIR